jgi:anthranilate synthase component 1
MRFLDKKNFLEKAISGKIFPVYKEIIADMETPVSVFLKIRQTRKNIYLLESIEGNSNIGRYSFIGLDEYMIFKAKGTTIFLTQNGVTEEKISENPVVELESLVKKFDPNLNFGSDLPPFYGGAVGYIGYEGIRYFEKSLNKTKKKSKDDVDFYDLYFVFAKDILVFDKVRNTMMLIANVLVGENKESSFEEGKKRLEILEQELSINQVEKNVISYPLNNLNFNCNTTKTDYMEMVKKAKKYIYDGDIFQIVLSQRWELEYKNDDFNIYRQLRGINPSPYMFYLKFDDYSVIGASPEVMVKRQNNKIIVRPIAGTRKRGANYDEDKQLEEDLLNDSKEISEHMMLLDLGRNDIGRIAKAGTVKLDESMTIERYSHVMHIVSQVSGEVDEDANFSDILKSVFPAGTVSGAPKIRAMEIIDELEKGNRGVYSGTVAYLGFNKNFDSCITIRTILKKGDKIYLQAGAGIVADSVPENEYFETINKIKVLFDAIVKSLDTKNLMAEIIYDFESGKIIFNK